MAKCVDRCPANQTKKSRMNALQQLKEMTVVVADTGDFEGKAHLVLIIFKTNSFVFFYIKC